MYLTFEMDSIKIILVKAVQLDIYEEATQLWTEPISARKYFKSLTSAIGLRLEKGQVFYAYFIMDEKRNTLLRSKFYDDMDECLEAARNRLDEMI